MVHKENVDDIAMAGAKKKSAARGGGKSTTESRRALDPAGNVKVKAGDTSADNRRRGQTAPSR
jgi:hypothetical protein